MRRALILCTGNSCRSQMAEAMWRAKGQGQWDVASAGSRPAGYVHPLARDVMREIGIDLTAARSKHVDEYAGHEFDVVVTVCDHAQEACPTLRGSSATLHWPFDDPALAEGADVDRLRSFRRVRDEIARAIDDYLSAASR